MGQPLSGVGWFWLKWPLTWDNSKFVLWGLGGFGGTFRRIGMA
jgi:hypothetical protein